MSLALVTMMTGTRRVPKLQAHNARHLNDARARRVNRPAPDPDADGAAIRQVASIIK